MYSTERIWDHRAVVHTISELWDEISEDNAPPYVPDIVNEYYIAVFHEKDFIGMYRFNQLNSVLWEGHAFILPKYREHAVESGKAIQKWIVDNLKDAKKVIANVPECFPNVIGFLKKMGFKEQGYSSDSYTKNGIVGLYQFGMTVEEMKCQQQQQ